MSKSAPVLSVRNLHTHFFIPEGRVMAVNGVSFDLMPGSTLGIVGESGSGKSVMALSLLRLIQPPGRILRGEVWFEGRNLLELPEAELCQIRGKDIAMILQGSATSLNPIMRVGWQVQETVLSHEQVQQRIASGLAMEALRRAGIPMPDIAACLYPSQLSGGMRQRVMVAMAIVLDPKVLIADEPTSALDATLQAEILDRIRRLKRVCGSAVILITHNLGVLAEMADEVAVMYAGSIIEHTDVNTLFKTPLHPYTAALLDSLPRLDQPDRPLRPIKGMPPSLLDLPDQCAFLPRCHKALSRCRNEPRPPLEQVSPNHAVACYNPVWHPS